MGTLLTHQKTQPTCPGCGQKLEKDIIEGYYDITEHVIKGCWAPKSPSGMSSPMELIEKVPEAKGKKEVPHRGKLIFASKMFNGTFDVSFHEAPVDSLLELEGKPVKLGPNGGRVETRMPKHYFENGVEITSDQVTELIEYDNGDQEPAQDLPKTKAFDIVEDRPLGECNLDATDITLTHGTTIPREEVAKYAVEKVHDAWEGVPLAFKKLAEYLEARNKAILFPYTFGRGRKVYTAIAYPVRPENKLYMKLDFATGQIIYRHPLEAPANAPAETQRVELPPIRIRNRQKTLAGVT